MFRADDDRQALAVDVLVEQPDEPLLLLDHQQQRLQRPEREPLIFAEQRRRAVHVQRARLGQIGKRRGREPHRARHQRVVQQPFFVHPLEHRFARPRQRQPGKLRVQIVGRLAQIVGVERFADLDHLLDDMTAARDDDDEHAGAAERNELDAIEHRRLVRRAKRETDVARRLGHHVRGLREDRVDERPRALAPQLGFDRAGGARRALRFEQQVDVEAVAAVGGDAAGRGVRLLDEAFFFEPGEDAAYSRRRHAEPGGADEKRRGNGLARRDVLAHERGQHPLRAFVGFH